MGWGGGWRYSGIVWIILELVWGWVCCGLGGFGGGDWIGIDWWV